VNVALHGMAHALGISSTRKGVRRGRYAFVSYADALAVLGPTRQEAMEAKDIRAAWLGPRGWRLSEAETPIRHLPAGFDCLGFTMRH